MYAYFIPRRTHILDAHAAISLIREHYGPAKCHLAPFGIGLVVLTSNPIPAEFEDTLGIYVWN